MKLIFSSLILLGSFILNSNAAVFTNKTTSPTEVTNIIRRIFTNGVDGAGATYTGNTNMSVTAMFILISKGTATLEGVNDVGELRIASLNSSGIPTTYGRIRLSLKNPTNQTSTLDFKNRVRGSDNLILQLTTNNSVFMSKQVVGYTSISNNTDFDVLYDSPFVPEPGIITFTNLTADRYVFLPDATNEVGVIYYFKNMSAANAPIITNTFGEKIEGATSYKLTNQFDSVTLFSDGVNWLMQSRKY
jgi:hypothetical protein